MSRPVTGLRPFQPRRPRLNLSSFLHSAYAPPVVADHASLVPRWLMYGNDRYSDCVWASIGHSIQSMTYYGGRVYTEPSVDDLLAAYSAVTGFHKRRPTTDNGTVLADGLNHWRKVGVGTDRIRAFAFVDKRLAVYTAAIDLFGFLNVGIDLPGYAWSRFERHRHHWTLPAPSESQAIETRHAVHVAGYDLNTRRFQLVTWGRLITCDWKFLHRYAREAWVVLSDDWLDAWGRSPRGLDLHALSTEFAALTGEADPLPARRPVPRDHDRTLWHDVEGWAGREHRGENADVAAALRTWADVTGLSER